LNALAEKRLQETSLKQAYRIRSERSRKAQRTRWWIDSCSKWQLFNVLQLYWQNVGSWQNQKAKDAIQANTVA